MWSNTIFGFYFLVCFRENHLKLKASTKIYKCELPLCCYNECCVLVIEAISLLKYSILQRLFQFLVLYAGASNRLSWSGEIFNPSDAFSFCHLAYIVGDIPIVLWSSYLSLRGGGIICKYINSSLVSGFNISGIQLNWLASAYFSHPLVIDNNRF